MHEIQGQIPAPERDLQNVSPQVPPASSPTSPAIRWVFGTLAIGLGGVMAVLALLGAGFDAAPVLQTLPAHEETAAWALIGGSGLFFVGCGIGILRRSLVMAVVCFVLAVISGATATAMS